MTDVTGKTGKGTARQTVRIDHDMWDEFEVAAKRLGTDRSTLIREFIEWVLRKEGAKTPRRPAIDELAE